jgi:hypothetical protein
MPLQATSGVASYDAFGGGVPVVPTYIEDVMSTWVYDGTGASLTITNGIDLSTKGGMVWIKQRTSGTDPVIFDTLRGAGYVIQTNDPGAQYLSSTTLTGFTTSGFSLGNSAPVNASSASNKYVSWSFRKAPKFFDVVTWTGSGSNREISHALGSVPACIIVKQISSGDNAWQVYHRSLANTEYLVLNTTAAKATGATRWNSTTPTSTVFSLGTDATVNASGETYVAYLFAHDAGGFGLTGTDNVISCGSYTGSSTVDVDVNLGYEPQWVMIKNVTTGATDWYIADIMRGIALTGIQPLLAPNLSDAETDFSGTYFTPTATGMKVQYGSGTAICSAGNTYIYIAIRRGPMKVPTSGTSVFEPVTYTGTGAAQNIVGPSLPTDLFIGTKNQAASNRNFFDRLRGAGQYIRSDTTGSEQTNTNTLSSFAVMNGVSLGTATMLNQSEVPYIGYFMRRAPGFFDEVCFTTVSSSDMRISHNLGIAPEIILLKSRSLGAEWTVYYPTGALNKYLSLNSTATPTTTSGYNFWGATAPSSTTFGLNVSETYGAGATMVAYLFATCAGVSKVTSFTGNGSSQTINCGFTAGSRFVMIKRTDSTGDWYVWDSARGIVSGNDPHLSLNSTAAEVTTDDTIDTDSTGFVVNQVSATNVNVSSATYIVLAIA